MLRLIRLLLGLDWLLRLSSPLVGRFNPFLPARRLDPFRSLFSDLRTAIERNLLMIDPPNHTRLRALVAELLGLPREDRAAFERRANELAVLVDPSSPLGGLERVRLPEPDRLDLGRRDNEHTALGSASNR